MSWAEKGRPFSFEQEPINGLYFLDGDVIAARIGKGWTAGEKYPRIAFPSGVHCDVWEGKNSPIVHIYGEMDLPLQSSRDEAFEQANEIAEACGYAAKKVDEDKLEVWGQDDDEHFLIHYHPEQKLIVDIQQLSTKPEEKPVHPAHQLMTDELRHKLPPLYHNEHIGLEATAHVKYFTPSSRWTWYAAEFDGQDLLFGLVVGFEVELGYFSLSELKEIGDELGLPVERDLHYEPKTLRDLSELHKRNE